MGKLFLVRHGQASFLEENYDRLSELGEIQSRRLAEYWLRYDARFDRVYCGPLERQRRTEEIVAETFRQAGAPWPEAVTLPGLAEYEAERFLREYTPKLVQTDPALRGLHDDLLAAKDLHAKGKAYQRLFEAAVRAWIRGEIETEGIEKLDAFDRRVDTSLEQMMSESESGGRIVAFTSGGPCGLAVKRAVGCDLETGIELSWMVRNASVSEFLFTRDRFTLSAFNGFPHLEDPEHWTYR